MRQPLSSQKAGLKKGPWTPEEDEKSRLISDTATETGAPCLQKPDFKGVVVGLAAHLPKRTDNEIKNYWNTRLKKRLAKMGIDPTTHKPKINALDAEARLVRLRQSRPQLGSSSTSPVPPPVNNKNVSFAHVTKPPCLDVLKAWQRVVAGLFTSNIADKPTSPTSTLNFMESTLPVSDVGFGFVGNSINGKCVDSTMGSIDNAWWAGNAMELEGFSADTLMVCNAVDHCQQSSSMEARDNFDVGTSYATGFGETRITGTTSLII
ncbi:hypothetical protein F3Y22_tig00010263pilonHSYRG00190 [Hibiscus syriacus]|uniref:Uncharacterized protein n=1 Tax=Hibiscus syriacus TaxID=106335 RepID=A0A6A3C9V6_HIBSY|nr:hypothetical protein F3Y22_tig00010263pilonHSYRG00190 [Hibiscus syriacus]